jgi:archaellum component FlaC
MLKNVFFVGFLGLALGGGVVACERQLTRQQRIAADRPLAERLDKLENDWIRLKGELEGKSEVEQELDVARDEIDEELKQARKQLDSLGDTAESESTKARRTLDKALSELEQAIKKAREEVS